MTPAESAQPRVAVPHSSFSRSDLENYRHDQRALLALPGNIPLQVGADFFFDHTVVRFFFFAGKRQRVFDDLSGALHESIFADIEATGHNFGSGLDFSGQLVDGNDRQHDAVFAEVAAVFDDEIFDHIGAVAGVDADASDIDLACFARSEFVEFKNVSALDEHDFADRSAHGSGHFGVQLELTIFSVDRNKVARLDQVDDQLKFFLTCVSADMDWRAGTVFVDDVSLAAEEVVDHPVNGFFVARDDAAGKNDSVALLDFRVLVIIDRGPGERGHGLALRAADQDTDFFRRKILHFPGIDDQSLGKFDVAQVFGDLGRVIHGAADEGDLASVLMGELYGEVDAVNGTREARDEEATLGVGEDLVELAANGALTGRISLALDVGGILKQRQHALFAVFGEGVEIEKFVVGGGGIDFEIAGVNDDTERCVDGERNAINQAVRDLNRMDGEGSGFEALVGPHLTQVGVVE